MPTYGYRCTVCENKFETIQKITDPPLTACIECGGAVKKMLYPVGIQFKGSGFYVNDYAPKSGGDSASSGAKAGESKSETKPETTTETKSETTSAPATPAAPASAAPAATASK